MWQRISGCFPRPVLAPCLPAGAECDTWHVTRDIAWLTDTIRTQHSPQFLWLLRFGTYYSGKNVFCLHVRRKKSLIMWAAKHTFVYYGDTKAETSEGFSPLSCLLDLCCWSESSLCWWLLELLTDLREVSQQCPAFSLLEVATIDFIIKNPERH